MTGQLVVAALLATGCGAAQTPGECAAERYRDIESRRIATIAHRCRKYPSIHDCPRADGLEEKYERKALVVEQECAGVVR
jgi:hypothetical protein